MGRIQWPPATQLMFLIGIGLLIAALVGLVTLPTREPVYRTARTTISVDLLTTLQADIGRRMRQPIESREQASQPLSPLMLTVALVGLGLFSWWALGAPRLGQLARLSRQAIALGVVIAIPVLIVGLVLVVLYLVPGRGQAPPDTTAAATDWPGSTAIAANATRTALALTRTVQASQSEPSIQTQTAQSVLATQTAQSVLATQTALALPTSQPLATPEPSTETPRPPPTRSPTPLPSATPQIGQRGARIEATWPERIEVGRVETFQIAVVFVANNSTPTPSPPVSTVGPVSTVVVQISPSDLVQPTPLPGQPATTYQPCIAARLVGPPSLTLWSTEIVCQPLTGERLSWSWDVRADTAGVYDLTSEVEIIWVASDAEVAPVTRTLWERNIRLVATTYVIPTNQLGPLSLANAVVGTLLTIPATRRRLRGAPTPGLSGDELLKSLLAHHEQAARAAQPAHLNTRFDGIGERDPLPVGQRVPLIIWVGPQIDTSGAQSSRPFTYTFREHDTIVDFTVHVQGDPEQWTIKPIEPTMRVTSAGETIQEAEFIVTARRPGADKLYIHVERADDRVSVQHVWLPVLAGERAQALGAAAAPQAMPQAARAVRMPLGPGGIRRRTVELSIYSRREGSQFEMLVKADLPERRIFQFFEMPVSVQEIQNATLRLRQELQRIVLYPVEQGGETSYPFADPTMLSVDPAVARAATVALADAGQQVWQLLFRAPRADAELRQIGDLIRDLPEGGQIQIVIESQQFIIPWALLYDKPGPITAETLDWAGFWGYRYLIDILPPGNYPEPVIRGEPSINLLLSKDPDLIPFATAQRDYLRDTLHMHPSEAWGTSDVLQRLASLGRSTVLYVYCHGVHESGAVRPGALASESALSFSAGERIRIADMRRLPGGALPDHALVFLNACEGATQQAFYYDGFMPFFIEECGACGFIGTEVKTPMLLAHDLAQHFMRLFVQGGSVGQILWRLRRHYLNNHHTILGFNYTLYGLDELKIARAARADPQGR